MMLTKRVASLLPGATEILLLLELEQRKLASSSPSLLPYHGLLVGRSFECRYPSYISHIPILTNRSTEMHRPSSTNQSSPCTEQRASTITFEAKLFHDLQPDVAFISHALVSEICSDRNAIPGQPTMAIFSLDSVKDIMDTILRIGHIVDMNEEAVLVHQRMSGHLFSANSIVETFDEVSSSPTTLGYLNFGQTLPISDRINPQIMTADELARTADVTRVTFADYSRSTTGEVMIDPNAEVLLLDICDDCVGTTAHETALKLLATSAWFRNLKAVKLNQVNIVNTMNCFGHFGPRLVDGISLVVGICYGRHELIPSHIEVKALDCSAEGIAAAEAKYPISQGIDYCRDNVKAEPVKAEVIFDPEHERGTPEHPSDMSFGLSEDRFLGLEHQSNGVAISSADFVTERVGYSSYAQETVSLLSASEVRQKVNQNPIDKNNDIITDIESCHRRACTAQETFYEDPCTGLSVMTEHSLLKRGSCCGNKCRHCPYGHYNVDESRRGSRENLIQKPVLLTAKKRTKKNKKKVKSESEVTQGGPPCSGGIEFSHTQSRKYVYILFWSGEVLPFLALSDLYEQHMEQQKLRHTEFEVVLLTTCNASTGVYDYQNIPISAIMDQARQMELDLLVVPLPSACSNTAYGQGVYDALKVMIDSRGETLAEVSYKLVFGDLNCADVRSWRETSFGPPASSSPLSSSSSSSSPSTTFVPEPTAGLSSTDSPAAKVRVVPPFSRLLGDDYECLFPLYGLPQTDLLQRLAGVVERPISQSIRCTGVTVSSVSTELVEKVGTPAAARLAVGRAFDPAEILSLGDQQPGRFDLFGESGEFHTVVHFSR